MRIIYFICGLLSFSCNSKYKALTDYYNSNPTLHKEISDSLMSLADRYNTEIIMVMRPDLGDKIIFRYYSKSNNSRMPIEFDSALNRIDPYPEMTLKIEVPRDLLRKFKNTIYPAVISDSMKTFFGYRYSYGGESYYGILIDNSPLQKNEGKIRLLGPNVSITKGIIP